MPPTVADLEAEVSRLVGLTLDDVGLFLDRADGTTTVIRRGLRRGLKAVGALPADPLALADADLAHLSGFALERVLDEAELDALELADQQWYRAVQQQMKAVEPAPLVGGWREQQRRGLKDRIAHLRGLLQQPYREPGDVLVVSNPRPRYSLADGTLVPFWDRRDQDRWSL